MYEELRENAIIKIEEDRKMKKSILGLGVLFAGVAMILLIVSTRFNPVTAFWVRLPIPILAFVYVFIYTTAFGLPFTSQELTEEEIEREMVKIYRKSNLEKLADDYDHLELKEMEELTIKYDQGADLV